MKFDANGKKTEERKTDLLRSRSRSGSLRNISDTSATTSEIFIRSSTASSRLLMASGLHRGEQSHCFSNLLPVSRAHVANYYLITWQNTCTYNNLLPVHTVKYMYIQQSTICTHGHLLPVHTVKHMYTQQSTTCTHGHLLPVHTVKYLYTQQSTTCTHGHLLPVHMAKYLYTQQSTTCTHGHLLPVHQTTYLYTTSYCLYFYTSITLPVYLFNN